MVSKVIRIGISVEGQTEERFIKTVLGPYLFAKDVDITPFLMGGNVSVDRVKDQLKRFANNYDHVTTLYDFYGFKKKADDESKESLENRIKEAVDAWVKPKLIPYIQMYEFEGLLFSCPDAMADVLGEPGVKAWCQGVLKKFSGNPEKINNSVESAPSKRLKKKTGYKNMIHGPNIAKEIGIEKIREKCAGFNEWLKELEALAA